MQERIIPLYNDEILQEYREVLSREKFHLGKTQIELLIKAIITDGLSLDRTPATDITFPDSTDIVFYEVALSKEESYLVTGNIKHFPAVKRVITPNQMMDILNLLYDKN